MTRTRRWSVRLVGVVVGGMFAVGPAGPAGALSQGEKPCQPWSSQQRAVGAWLPDAGAAPFSNWC